VHRVGGLADTVVDADETSLREERATGFAFSGAHRDALFEAMRRVRACWENPPQWRAMMLRAMAQDSSWRGPAVRYAQLYASLSGDARQR